MQSQTQIDPMVGFRNSQGEAVRGTIVTFQRKSLVMEIYNPYSIVQLSEVLSELTVKLGSKNAYIGKAVVTNIVNTGLTAIISLTLIDEWRELSETMMEPEAVGAEAKNFVKEWTDRFRIRHAYQILVNEMRSFLSEVSRWVEQVDLSGSMPIDNGRLQIEFFNELAKPLVEKTQTFFGRLEAEAALVEGDLASAHRAFAQAALHPLLLRAPFVFRTYTKPLGYAGDYQMVNQMLEDPRQGPNTYFQIVNSAFLQASAATAHRNRIDILVDFLKRSADIAKKCGKPFRVLNVACGPAIEVQRFLHTYPEPELVSFELLDFSAETLGWTRERLSSISQQTGKKSNIKYVHDSVHELIKRRVDGAPLLREFDVVYCAGLFDYLSDKVCKRLLQHFAARTIPGGTILVTNVHSDNPEKLFVMEHLLEWYLIYRDETQLESLLPAQSVKNSIYLDATGINVFAEAVIP